MTTKLLLGLLLLCTASYSCQSRENNVPSVAQDQLENKAAPPAAESDMHAGNTSRVAKRVIQQGYLRIRSKKLAADKAQLDLLMKRVGAYYADEDLQQNEADQRYALTIRVPDAHFDALVQQIVNMPVHLENRHMNRNDVSASYTDAESRLKHKKACLAQYLELLKQAHSIPDILSLKDVINGLQEEIEVQQGRLNHLDDQLAYAQLRIDLVQPLPEAAITDAEPGFGSKVWDALSSGFDGVLLIVLGLIQVWPLLLLLAFGFYLLRNYLRKHPKQTAKQ